MCISNYVVVVVVVVVAVVAVVKKVPRCKSIFARWMRKDQIPMRKDKQTNGKPSDSYEGRFEHEW